MAHNEGLLTSASPQALMANQPAPAQAPDPAAEGELAAATPEEQAVYDKFMDNAFNIVYDEKAMPDFIKSIQGDGDPVTGLASATLTVLERLEESAEQALGKPADRSMMMAVQEEITEDLANLSRASGQHEFSEQEIGNANNVAALNYGQNLQKAGKLNDQESLDEFMALVEADKAGALDSVMQGINGEVPADG